MSGWWPGSRREWAEAVVLALAIASGAALFWNQAGRWVVEPLPPVYVSPRSVTSELVDMGDHHVQRIAGLADVNETCVPQRFERALFDLNSNTAKAPDMTASTTDPRQMFERWLPLGPAQKFQSDVRVEWGRQGTIELHMWPGVCPSGFSRHHLVYSIPYDWTTRPPGVKP